MCVTTHRTHESGTPMEVFSRGQRKMKAVITVSLIKSETLSTPKDDWMNASVTTEADRVVIETEQERLLLENDRLLEKIRKVLASPLDEIFYNPKHRMLLIPGAFAVIGSSFLRVDTEAATGLRG
ncbi:hypothetical protein GCM10010038_26600 [Glutamicibacter protophormiae]|nr:hypothetical protein GCM10010038_26600 [Glutamicibacter protophormiae]